MARFVGRESELAILRQVLRTAGRRHVPAVAAIVGDPGAGKSRLLDEALARERPARVVAVVGYQPEAGVALAAARGLVREARKAERHGPRLQQMLAGGPRTASGRAPETLHLFETIHRCVAELAPVVIVADDLQWVDDTSLALCHFLVRAARSDGDGLTMLAASRESHRVRSFLESLAAVLGRDDVGIVELTGLPRSDALTLVRELAPQLGDEAAAGVCRRAAGSPFWLHVLSRGLDAGADGPSFVRRRMRSVSADAAWLLALLATAGAPLTLPSLASMLDWPPARADAAVNELVTVGLAIVDGVSIRPAHDLLREAALSGLPTTTTAYFHRRLAEAIERDAGDDVQALSRAVEHRLAAGTAPLDLALRIGTAPGRRLIGPDGVRRLASLLDRGTGTLESNESAPADYRRLRRVLAELAREVGPPTVALNLWQEEARGSTSLRDRAWAELTAARIAFLDLGRADIGELLLASSRRDDDPVLRIEQDVLASVIARHAHKDARTAADLANRALAAVRERVSSVHSQGEEVDTTLRRAWLDALGGAYDDARLALDDPELMLLLAEEMVVASDGLRDAFLAARFNVAMSLRAQGRWREARQVFAEVWERSLDDALPTLTASTGYWFADVLRAVGELRESRRVAGATLGIAARVDDERAGVDARWLLHVLDLSTGDWRAAIAALEGETADESEPHARIDSHATIAEWLARFGAPADTPKVFAHLAAGAHDAAAASCARCQREFALRSAETLARAGDVDAARRSLDASDTSAPRRSAMTHFWRERAGALVTLAESGPAAAMAGLTSVVELADAMGLRLEASRARLDLGAALVVIDRRKAVGVLRAAAEDAHTIGASTEARAARRALRRLGVRVGGADADSLPRISGAPDALTPSELAVARLAATGASNREIAASLFIAPKTVERHVSRALAKSGVRNRTELAARIRELSGVPSDRRP